MDIFEEFRGIAGSLEQQGLRYALVGGVALAIHGFPRFTQDIDLLLHPDDLSKFVAIVASLGFEESASAWEFNSAKILLYRYAKVQQDDVLLLDVLVPQEELWQSPLLRSLKVSDGAQILRLVSKQDLIALKRLRNSEQDQVDIANLELADGI